MKERVANQLFLFDMIEYSSENTGSCKVCVVDSISEEKQLLDYLYQGERILSLLREKEVRIVRHKLCDFFERFNISSYIEKLHSGGVYDYIEQTAIRQAREWWEKNDRMDVETNDLLRYLSKYLSIDAKIITDGSKPGLKELIDYFFRKSEAKSKGVITIKSLRFRRDYEVPVGVKSTISKSKHLREYRWKNIMSDYYCIADAGRLFFMPLLLCVLKEQIQIAIQNLSETERSTNILYCYLINQMEQNVSKRCYDKKEGSKIPILLKGSMLERPFVRKLQLRYPNLLYIECEEEQKLDFLDIELLLFSWFLSKEEEDRVSFEVSQDISILHIKGVLEQVCDVYTTEKQMYEIMNELKKESAKVYQTKKNISLKCQKAMISSSFNHYFGYIELDDECDLEKFFEIEQQFQALSSYLFHGKKYEEVSNVI